MYFFFKSLISQEINIKLLFPENIEEYNFLGFLGYKYLEDYYPTEYLEIFKDK